MDRDQTKTSPCLLRITDLAQKCSALQLPLSTRNSMLRALRYLNLRDLQDYEALSLQGARLRLGDRWHRCGVRTGVRTLLKLRSGQSLGDRAAFLDPAQTRLLSKFIGQIKPTERARVRRALTTLGWRSVEDVRRATHAEIYARLATADDNGGRLMQATNHLLRAAGRMDLLHRTAHQRHRRGGLSETEHRWLTAAVPCGSRDWYRAARTSVDALVCPDPRYHAAVLRLLRQLDRADWRTAVTVDALRTAVVALIRGSFAHHSSLVVKGRHSRCGQNASVPGLSTAKELRTAACVILRLAGRTTDDAVRSALRPPVLCRQAAASVSLVDLAEFTDEVCGADAVRMIQVARDDRERLLALLLCRLGMRIGAIHKLRLSGVLEAPAAPGAGAWTVRPVISGVDKGARINEWSLTCAPGVHEALQAYVDRYWRPRYEQWTATGTLVNGFLFPSAQHLLRRGQPASVGAIRRWAGALMHHAGISGFNAHTHACRKGYASDLLRADNKPEVVARALHHRSLETTLNHYDKRSRTEVLANLKFPSHGRFYI